MTPEGRIVRPLKIVKHMSKVFSQMTISLTLLKLSKLETTSDGKVLRYTTMNNGSISTHMQACPPAMNVILIYQTSNQNQKEKEKTNTDKFEYIPGIRALVTLSGRGESHLSGFHSSASGPHISTDRFTPRIAMKTSVLWGTRISPTSVPSLPTIGLESGSTVSFRALNNVTMSDIQNENHKNFLTSSLL